MSTSTSTSTSASSKPKDWSSTQYLKFSNERTRAVHDLIAQIHPLVITKSSKPRIYDLGCGPANSTAALLSAFPSAKITGMDSSPDMLNRARATLPDVEFVQGDLATFEIPTTEEEGGRGADLVFSNAVFHWLRRDMRIATLKRIFQSLKPGGVVAIQVPDNYNEASHRLMRETAGDAEGSWSKYFEDTRIGDLKDSSRPDLDPIEAPREFYNALMPLAESVNIWRTNYQHVLKDAGAIVEWVKGTGLQPYLNRIEDEEAKKAFLAEYERRLKGEYKYLVDGKVLLGYPRLFVVAMRK